MNLKDIILSEINLKRTNTEYDSTYMRLLDSTETESRMVITKG